MANKLHKAFGEKIEEDTLKQIESCRYVGAKFQIHDGFKKRNDSVALSDYLIAFSWSEGEEPTKKGGTRDTWGKAGTGNKLHVPLSSVETNYTRKMILKETPVELENESSSEICDSQVITHAEPPMPQKSSPTHNYSQEVPSACPLTANPEHSSQNSMESLDSGLGSLDSRQSGSKSPEMNFQSNRKRKRRCDSTDISDESDIEGDDDKVNSTAKILLSKQSNSKKLKVSEFIKQALPS